MSDEDPFAAFDSTISQIGEVNLDEIAAAEKEKALTEAIQRLVNLVNSQYAPEKLAEVIDSCLDDLELVGGVPVDTELVLNPRFGYHNVWEITARRVR